MAKGVLLKALFYYHWDWTERTKIENRKKAEVLYLKVSKYKMIIKITQYRNILKGALCDYSACSHKWAVGGDILAPPRRNLLHYGVLVELLHSSSHEHCTLCIAENHFKRFSALFVSNLLLDYWVLLSYEGIMFITEKELRLNAPGSWIMRCRDCYLKVAFLN